MKYEEYKDSGVAWIGEIPSHWVVAAFKRRISINNGRDYKEFQDDEIYPVMGSGGCFAYCSRYMYDGEALLLGRKGTIDKPLYINGKFWTVDTMFYAIPNKDLDCKFAYYLAITFPFNLYSTSTALPSMTQTDLGNNPVAFPTLVEQQAIASYLDKKCGKINGAIDVQKKKIDLLNELKQTIITNAVTKGLNPNAPMKDSGVEWIGEIPEHWKIKRTRFLCNIQTGDKDTVNREDDGLYPFYVRSPKVERINTYSFDGEAVLMAGDGVGAGKVFHYANGKFDYHQRVYNLHNFKDVSGLFFHYYILNKFRYIIEEGAAKNTVDSVRLNMIQDFWMTIPPVSEQQNIVKYIDGEISKIDSQIAKANQRIELLNELKQSIITEAITGKIKVC